MRALEINKDHRFFLNEKKNIIETVKAIAKRCESHFIINLKHREASCVLYCVAKIIYKREHSN